MDTSLGLKPAAAVAPRDDGRSAGGTRTAAAPDVAVAAQAASAATNAANAPSAAASRAPDVVLDPQSRELVYRSADVRARRAARQAAEKAMLRERAYTRAARDKTDAGSEREGERSFDTTA